MRSVRWPLDPRFRGNERTTARANAVQSGRITLWIFPYAAAARGYIDDVIDPRDTRARLIDGLRTLRTKRDRNPPRKHGNIPL